VRPEESQSSGLKETCITCTVALFLLQGLWHGAEHAAHWAKDLPHMMHAGAHLSEMMRDPAFHSTVTPPQTAGYDSVGPAMMRVAVEEDDAPLSLTESLAPNDVVALAMSRPMGKPVVVGRIAAAPPPRS
jgi:hypothetical protein